MTGAPWLGLVAMLRPGPHLPVAQPVGRLIWDQEVASSNLAGQTTNLV